MALTLPSSPRFQFPATLRSWTAATLLGVGFALAPQAIAAPIPLGNGPGPGSSDSFVFNAHDYGIWFVADLSDPITPAPLSVTPTSSAGPWTLNFGFDIGAPNLTPGDTFEVSELFQVGAGDFSVTTWTQEITTAGWKWTAAGAFDYDTSFELDGLNVNLTDPIATLSFDPLLADTTVFIVKTLEYTGVAGAATPLSVDVSAIPEPSTTVLMLGALLAVAWARKRQCSTPFASL